MLIFVSTPWCSVALNFTLKVALFQYSGGLVFILYICRAVPPCVLQISI